MKKLLRKILLISFLFTAVFTVWLIYLILDMPQLPEDLAEFDLSSNTVIYAADGNILQESSGRTYVPIDQMSPYLTKSVLAIEDHTFYDHAGIYKRGIIRMIIKNIFAGRYAHGGSTITQQVAKNLFLSFNKTIKRKFQDMLLAMQMERRYEKDDILEAYCNQVNYGGIFGIENASLHYFGKHALDLNLAEASLLASVPNYPISLYQSIDRAITRQRTILNRLLDLEWIEQTEYDEAMDYEFSFRDLLSRRNTAGHFIRMVRSFAADKYGIDVVNYGGLKIYTTLDMEMQEKAAAAVEEGLLNLDTRLGLPDFRLAKKEEKNLFPQCALASVDPSDGKILALVGARESKGDYFNRATLETPRSPGSSFKPFLYFTAIKEGVYNSASVMVDSQSTYQVPGGEWTPRNFDETYIGETILKYAFMRSINTIAAQMISEIGPESVIETANNAGIGAKLDPVLSLALGSQGVPVIEMAEGYSTIFSGGLHNDTYFIKRIEDSSGNVLYQDHIPTPERVLDPTNSYLILDLFQGTLESGGTGERVRNLGFRLPAGGKTGTTNDFRDAWFAGGTPDNVTVVWVGYDDFSPMVDPNGGGITGSSGAMPVWTLFMRNIENRLSGMEFPVPNTIEFKYFNKITGIETNPDDPDAIRAAVKK